MSSWKSFDDMILQKMFSCMSLAYTPICFHFYECGQAGISSKDGIVHGIAMGFAPTQLADVMVKSLPNPLLGDEFSFWLHAWLCFLVYSL
jgi:hypothetical protein